MNNCGNCKNFEICTCQMMPGEHGHCLIKPAVVSTPDMTCPRHGVKIKHPEWIPVWHIGDNDPQDNAAVIAFWGKICDKAWFRNGKWESQMLGKISIVLVPDFWTYLPEGWE